MSNFLTQLTRMKKVGELHWRLHFRFLLVDLVSLLYFLNYNCTFQVVWLVLRLTWIYISISTSAHTPSDHQVSLYDGRRLLRYPRENLHYRIWPRVEENWQQQKEFKRKCDHGRENKESWTQSKVIEGSGAAADGPGLSTMQWQLDFGGGSCVSYFTFTTVFFSNSWDFWSRWYGNSW